MNTGKSASNFAPTKHRERTRGISNLIFQVKLGVTIAFIALVFATVLSEDSYHFGAAAQATTTANEVNDQQLTGQLLNVETFNPNNPHEVRSAAGNLNPVARGALGFNPASLLGVFQRERFLTHDGSVTSFEQLFENQAHVGTHPKLKKAASRKNLIKFLRSIDDNTVPF